MISISVIIPFYNERGNLSRLLPALNNEIRELSDCNFKVFLIDDKSTDSSLNEAENFVSTNNLSYFYIIKHDRNMGKTEAIKSALKYIDTDFSILMDGDYQDDPKQIKYFIKKIKDGYELIIGNQNKNYNILVSFSSIIYKLIIYIFLNKFIKTPSPQYFAVKNKYIKNIILKKNYHRYISILSIYQNAKFCEIDVNYLKREYGESKFSKFKVFGAILEIINLFYKIKKKKIFYN
jgi:glycosyltransferase involved in cell wall biosynthesis